MAAAVHPAADEFHFDHLKQLFQTQRVSKIGNLFDVAPDGQRFLMNLPLESPDSSSIAVMTNWLEKLQQMDK